MRRMWGQQLFKMGDISICLYADKNGPLRENLLMEEREQRISKATSSSRQGKKGSWQKRDVGIC